MNFCEKKLIKLRNASLFLAIFAAVVMILILANFDTLPFMLIFPCAAFLLVYSLYTLAGYIYTRKNVSMCMIELSDGVEIYSLFGKVEFFAPKSEIMQIRADEDRLEIHFNGLRKLSFGEKVRNIIFDDLSYKYSVNYLGEDVPSLLCGFQVQEIDNGAKKEEYITLARMMFTFIFSIIGFYLLGGIWNCFFVYVILLGLSSLLLILDFNLNAVNLGIASVKRASIKCIVTGMFIAAYLSVASFYSEQLTVVSRGVKNISLGKIACCASIIVVAFFWFMFENNFICFLHRRNIKKM